MVVSASTSGEFPSARHFRSVLCAFTSAESVWFYFSAYFVAGKTIISPRGTEQTSYARRYHRIDIWLFPQHVIETRW